MDSLPRAALRGVGDFDDPDKSFPARPNAPTRHRRLVASLCESVGGALNALSESRAGQPLRLRAGQAIAGFRGRLGAAVRTNLRSRLRHLLPSPAADESAGALAGLLKSSSTEFLSGHTSVEPYDASRVNVVHAGVVPIDVFDVVPHDVQAVLRAPFQYIVHTDPELCSRPDESFPRAYSDPVFVSNPSLLKELIFRLHRLGLSCFTLVRRATVGVFTVTKKGGQLRLVFDCRPANYLHRSPPHTPLATPQAFNTLRLNTLPDCRPANGP